MTRYIELLEFAVTENSEEYADRLFAYLMYLARIDGARFLRVGKREDFAPFYSYVARRATTETAQALYVAVEDPIEYEEYRHVRHYEGDGCLDFSGERAVPKIWSYFLTELLAGADGKKQSEK